MSTTPQRYETGSSFPLWKASDGPYILFTDHEADKARTVEEVQMVLDSERLLRQMGSEAIATQQATIARLTKELEARK